RLCSGMGKQRAGNAHRILATENSYRTIVGHAFSRTGLKKRGVDRSMETNPVPYLIAVKQMNKVDGWRRLVNLLGLIIFLLALQARGQGERRQTTSEQVTQAVRETQKLCENQIQKGAVPGLAIAVVFQDQVVYADGFGVRDVN